MELLYHLFLGEIAKEIGALPIRRIDSPDMLVWHFNKNGAYSVKSGYHLLSEVEQSHTLAPTVDGATTNTDMKRVWNTIWRARIPNIIRVFGWRMCQEILPSFAAL